MAKEKYLTTKQVLVCERKEMENFYVKKIIQVKVRNVLQKTDQPEMDSFSEERNPDTKNNLKLRLQFARKVCHKCTVCNYEI